MELLKSVQPVATVVIAVAAIFGLFTWLNFSVKQDVRDLKTEMNLLKTEMNFRFNDVNQKFNDVNQKFNDVNRRLDKLYELQLQNKRASVSKN